MMQTAKKLLCISLFFLFLATFSEGFSAEPAQAKDKETATLYYLPTCPYCKRVEAYLKSVHKTVVMKDIHNAKYREELVALGQNSVPVLVVKGKVIVGSTPIISYLSQHPSILK